MLLTVDPPVPPEDEDDTPLAASTHMAAATRYLCAGAYLDSVFRDRALREVYYERKRYVAPSHGFDLAAVLHSCLRARNLTMMRDGAIVLLAATATYLNWVSIAIVAVVIVSLRFTAAAWRLVRAFLARVRTGTATDTTKSPRRGLYLLLGWAAMVVALTVLTSLALSATTRTLSGPRSTGAAVALVLALTIFVLPTFFALYRLGRIAAFAAGGSPPPVRFTKRLREIDEQQRGNTVVYSNFEPFIGSGDVISTWSFALRLVEKSPDLAGQVVAEGVREFPVPPFSAVALVDYVRERLQSLTTTSVPELSIPHMTIQDRIFESDREFGTRSLVTEPDQMTEIIRNPANPQRHYLACEGIGWDGDVVTTVHVHIAVQGRSLYLESTSTLMAPCNEAYRVVDRIDGTGPRAFLRTLTEAVRATPEVIVHAPGRFLQAAGDVLSAGSGAHRRPHSGVKVSVRQLGTRDKLRTFAQVQEILKFRKLIENRVYAHVLDYLDEHKVDTSEVRAQRATILNNNGIFVSGNMTVTDSNVSNQTTGSSND